MFAAYFAKYLHSGGQSNYVEETDEMINSVSEWFSVRFNGYIPILIGSTIISYVTYFGIGGFLHVTIFSFATNYK